jgi:thiazole synthase
MDGQRRPFGPAAAGRPEVRMRLFVNGDEREIPDNSTVAGLLEHLGVPRERVAVEVNGEVVRKALHGEHRLAPGDRVEVVAFVGGGAEDVAMAEQVKFGKYAFTSRLFVGTGKYVDFPTMKAALEASGSELVTVAVRRLDLDAKGEKSLLSWIPEGMTLLPNTAGCFTADDAIRTCRLARELWGGDLVKLEVLSDPKTLFPDVEETLKAAKVLVKEGFTVLPYTSDDPVTARKLEDAGCAAVMPLAAPIGSGLGIRNPYNLLMILEQVKVPVLVDAGVGTASDVAIAMELGCDAVLLNTAIAGAKDPVRMARAMKLACEAGREAYLAGRIPKKLYGSASSPIEGTIAATPRA